MTEREQIKVQELLIEKKRNQIDQLKNEISGHYVRIREIERNSRQNEYDNWEKSIAEVLKHTKQ